MGEVRRIAPEVLRELLDYDPETGVLTWRWRDQAWSSCLREHMRWNATWAGKEAGRINIYGYRLVKVLGQQKRAHCVIWAMVHDSWIPDGYFVDHINGDRADNRLENLRKATRSENGYNRAKGRNNTSGVKGVNYYPPNGKWCARLGFEGRKIHLGYFDALGDAAEAYRKAAEALYGDFAETSR